MTGARLRCAIVASTGGSVMNELLRNAFFRAQVATVVSDRACPAIDKARRHGVPAIVVPEPSAAAFCERLLAHLRAEGIDYVVSFFTKLFVGRLLEAYRDRILNLHPSLLPAFKGLGAFEAAGRAGVRYVGTTIHLVDERMDEGKIVLQSILPLDPDAEPALVRHRLFEQQCKSLLQVVRWLADGRIAVADGRVRVHGASFRGFEFSPDLDFAEAAALRVPLPPGRLAVAAS